MTDAPHDPQSEKRRISEQASQWVVLCDDRDLTAAEQSEFDQWLADDPRHLSAWRKLSSTWATIPVLNTISDLVPLEPLPAVKSRRGLMRAPRIALGALSAVAATLLALAVAPSLLSESEVYETGLAQTQLLTLDDGSQVTLGPRSKLTVRFAQKERRVVLAGGEAFFEVAHNKDRPFFVEAGRSVTRVVGTKFDVNYAPDSVRVGVLEGRVQVSRPDKDSLKLPATALLQAGQRAEISMAAGPAITRLPALAPGAWREGRLVYDGSRLSDLVADVNRYYAPGVTVADKTILDLRVTASFKASEIPGFMSAVGTVLPVKAIAGPNGSYRLEAAGQ